MVIQQKLLQQVGRQCQRLNPPPPFPFFQTCYTDKSNQCVLHPHRYTGTIECGDGVLQTGLYLPMQFPCC